MVSEIKIKESEKFLVGGISGIVDIISNYCGLNDTGKLTLRKQFSKKSCFKIKNLNCFSLEQCEEIMISIAMQLFSFSKEEEVKERFISSSLPFGVSHFHEDNNIAVRKMLEFSNFDKYDKDQMLRVLDQFELDIDFEEIVNVVYDEEILFKLLVIVDFVKNPLIEKENRLIILSKFLKKLNKSILENDEIVKRKGYSYKKECALKINNILKKASEKINIELNEYIKILKNDYQNILDDKNSREFILGALMENNKKLDFFLKCEAVLEKRGYISTDYSKWIKSPVEFIKFYKFCEDKNVFKLHYEKKSKGVTLLRELYNFSDGKSIDKPIKRNKYNLWKVDYYFLMHL
ncbi:hypothetical protein ACHRVK_20915 [Flavobacterium plurextorum]|uniref:hypothetical protein n=1 Tax=Flavobacterium TaxID=237 RepID=UPI00375728FC